jgi:ribosome-associated heat shock protein Hsp15
MSDGLRVDKWLWAARFFKTRSLAAQAVGGGKVQVNGGRAKPARPIRVGDRLQIHKAGFDYSITVLALSERRGPAAVAQTLYEESEDSRQRREILRERQRLAAATTPRPPSRPDKKARRQLRDLKW